ncbi:G-protein-signaling modulator 3 [Tursiops truncatus]|uniref:G-protein-signaling modulator 3 n=1 Tax=Tursiops truncatus TaxID=9739 RepID=A0A6J3S0F9_TURTR|nr:G-protein-signaling modulator 3 [Tursiops truncatus]
MEAERPQEEEDGEQHQGPHQDEHGWPTVNTSNRPWRSAPPSPPPPGSRHTALGPRSASLLSLQTELLLDLVAEAQSRRLEEQRATFHPPQNRPSLGQAPPRPLEDREQLYSTILSHQSQRMEAQRSEPPLPPGGQELLELLLRVQGGGRMEEQRSQPPPKHLLRLEPHQPLCTPAAQKLGSPLHALNPARQGHQRLEDPAEISVFIALIHLSWELERVKSSNPGNSQGRMDIELPP